MRFSLIVATLGRRTELLKLLSSLKTQSFQDFEIIIIDQNEPGFLDDILDAAISELPIKHLQSSERNSSHARNLGLHAATGALISFPDDDCFYPETLLSAVHHQFLARPEMAMLSGPSVTPEGRLSSGRWSPLSRPQTPQTIWTSLIEFNFFVKTELLLNIGGFDEELGVGARFGSSEAVDVAIRLMTTGAVAAYDFNLRVYHPEKARTPAAVERAYRYGTGMGRVIRKHLKAVGPLTAINFASRPLAGLLWEALRLNMLQSRYYWRTFLGRVSGFIAPT
jgi:glycosyltransferase involved in cell wall biosynthesis